VNGEPGIPSYAHEPLNMFFRTHFNLPEPSFISTCCVVVQDRVTKYLQIQRDKGMYISTSLRSDRRYKNPDFLQKMVDHFEIAEWGSNFDKEKWDPHGLPKEDFFDELAKQVCGSAQCMW
jgi:HCNGP-like protein